MTFRRMLHLWEAFRWKARRRRMRQSHECKAIAAQIAVAVKNKKPRRDLRLKFARALAKD